MDWSLDPHQRGRTVTTLVSGPVVVGDPYPEILAVLAVRAMASGRLSYQVDH